MPENVATDGKNTTDQPETTPDSPKTPDSFEPITSQDDLNRIIGERVARERKKYADYDELREKAAKYDKVEEANKTELEKAQERAARAEAKAAKAEMQSLRAEVAAAKAVPVGLLHGANRDELEACADALLKFRDDATGGKPTRKLYNPVLGQSQNASDSDKNAALRGVIRNLFQPE